MDYREAGWGQVGNPDLTARRPTGWCRRRRPGLGRLASFRNPDVPPCSDAPSRRSVADHGYLDRGVPADHGGLFPFAFQDIAQHEFPEGQVVFREL